MIVAAQRIFSRPLDGLGHEGHVKAESLDGGLVAYSITREGYNLLYHMSIVDEKLSGFFPQRENFDHLRRKHVERELTELLFRLSR